MPSSLDSTIREKLSAYLAKEISLREFEDWFFPETWEVDQPDDFSLINLVYGIKLRLAEFSHSDWTEDELRDWLRPFVESFEVTVNSTPPRVRVQFSTSSLTEPKLIYSAQSVSIRVADSVVTDLDQLVDTKFLEVSL